MNYSEFKLELKSLKVTLKEFAFLVDMEYSNFGYWSKTSIPSYAIVILDFLKYMSIGERAEYLHKKLVEKNNV